MLGMTVELGGNDLDGDDTSEEGIKGLVDRPHATLTQLEDNLGTAL